VEFIDRGEKEVAAMDVDRTSCHACPEPDPTRKNKRGPRGTHIYRGRKELICHACTRWWTKDTPTTCRDGLSCVYDAGDSPRRLAVHAVRPLSFCLLFVDPVHALVHDVPAAVAASLQQRRPCRRSWC
jgi:hypothetical protein